MHTVPSSGEMRQQARHEIGAYGVQHVKWERKDAEKGNAGGARRVLVQEGSKRVA